MSNIENLKGFDPFADAAKGDDDGVQGVGLVHVRIQQRNGRKTLTTVQGLSAEYDLKVSLQKKIFISGEWYIYVSFTIKCTA